MDLFEKARGHPVGSLFYSEDAPGDVGIYRVRESPFGPLYRMSVDKVGEAKRVCDGANSGKLDFEAYSEEERRKASERSQWEQQEREKRTDLARRRDGVGAATDEDLRILGKVPRVFFYL